MLCVCVYILKKTVHDCILNKIYIQYFHPDETIYTSYLNRKVSLNVSTIMSIQFVNPFDALSI